MNFLAQVTNNSRNNVFLYYRLNDKKEINIYKRIGNSRIFMINRNIFNEYNKVLNIDLEELKEKEITKRINEKNQSQKTKFKYNWLNVNSFEVTT